MKRVVSVFFFLPLLLFAQVHYAKLEPVETYVIKSAVSGKVLFADDNKEGTIGTKAPLIRIDDKVDRAQLKALNVTLETLEETLLLTEDMAENQEAVYNRDADYYFRIKDLKTKSKTEKDRVFATMSASKNQLLSLKEKIANLKKQIAETEYRILQLQDSIEKKSINAENLYIYKVSVRKGDFVNPGTPLLTLMDLSSGRLVLFLDVDEVENLGKKSLFLNGKKTDLKFEKVLKVADDVHISAYRAEIILNNPEGLFSKLIKVEIK